MAGECDLIDRETGKAPKTNDPFWQKGESQVSGPSADVADYAAAKEDALRRARDRCSREKACEGTDCTKKDCICVMDVEIVRVRSGTVEKRTEHIPAGHFVAHDEVRYYATYEVEARCHCDCKPKPKTIIPGTGPSQQYPPVRASEEGYRGGEYGE